MNIALIEPLQIPKQMLAAFAQEMNKLGHAFTSYDQKPKDLEELKRRVDDQDIIMLANHPLPYEAICSNDRLKMIDVAFTGTDHICVKEAKEKNILICNASGYSDISVSELVLGMVLSCYRKLPDANEAIRHQKGSEGFIGREIYGKNVAIVGTGKIGLQTAKLFKAFGANLYAISRTKKQEAIELGIKYGSFDDIFPISDIVSIHLPLTDETKSIIGKKEFSLLKDGALVINCARGQIINQTALVEEALKGRLQFAIDVFDQEPPLVNYPLFKSEALLSPHIAYYTQESMIRRAKIVFENVRNYLAGSPSNVI